MRLNIGCGLDYRDGYVNIDFADFASNREPIKTDLKIDIRAGLPYNDFSIEEVVFKETLEHFNRLDGFEALKEIFRVLQYGGILDLSVPNSIRQMKKLILYAGRKDTIDRFLNPHTHWCYWKCHEDLMGATQITFKDGIDYGQGDSHKTLWTRGNLEVVLEYLGFKLMSVIEEDHIFIKAYK